MKSANKKYKAVGLLSGGLDSAIAAKLILDQGIEVHAVNIDMPWGCGHPSRVIALSKDLGMTFKSIPLGDDYLSILKSPKYGFGSAHNPCVDCHIYMIRKASDYMREIGAEFIFTGEVLGQRPMSQRRECLGWVEKDSGIPGRLLRPMSAKLLPPTIPEEAGIVDREKLLDISGRSRKPQYALVKAMGLTGYSAPGGGCLLTEELFGKRLKDALGRGCPDIASTAVLGLGRYFRIDENVFVILGRDERENEKLIRFAIPQDILLQPTIFPGPVALVRGLRLLPPCGEGSREGEILTLAASLSQYHSKFQQKDRQPLACWVAGAPGEVRQVMASAVAEADVAKMLL